MTRSAPPRSDIMRTPTVGSGVRLAWARSATLARRASPSAMPISTLCRTIRASQSCEPPGKGADLAAWMAGGNLNAGEFDHHRLTRCPFCVARSADLAASIASSACRTSLSAARHRPGPRAGPLLPAHE